jgi:malate permease and related proteins
MSEFLHIIFNIIVPIFVIIGIGFAMDRKFRMDLDTLSKLNFWVFVPALLFVKLLDANISATVMFSVGIFTLVQMVLLFLLCIAAYSHHRLIASRAVLSMGTIINNCGNYGIPLVIFAFPDRERLGTLLGALAVIICVQNLLSFTFGVWLFERRKHGTTKILLGFAKIPVVYAAVIAILMRWLSIQPPQQIGMPMRFLSDGLVAIALITLGAQLSRSIAKSDPLPLAAVSLMRLVVSPLIAAAMLPFFGWHLHTALGAMLVVIAGMPVGVNVYILAAEYKRDEALASQAIFWTTLISPITLAILLALCR